MGISSSREELLLSSYDNKEYCVFDIFPDLKSTFCLGLFGQSVINGKITVNFEQVGKVVIDGSRIELRLVIEKTWNKLIRG